MTAIKKIKDTAFVLSVHEDVSGGTSRVNLKWQGNHEIFDFALSRIGKVMNCVTETENTGWAMIKNPRFLKPGDSIPLG
jgi:hypothetical protein